MKRTLALLLLASLWEPHIALGQPPPEPTVIVLRPSAEPRPALKYRLVPERRTLVPGNAAIFYHRGIQFAIERRMQAAAKERAEGRGGSESAEMQIANWVSGPLAKLPREEARKQIESFQSVLKEVELAATRLSCDWDLDRRTEAIDLLLPEIQEMRSLARLVALKARLAILDGKTDEAAHWIETGMVMGQHVSQGPSVIQALVGVAIDSVMLRCLEDLIQAPGTPSFYWALADCARPLIDMRYPLEGERYLLEKELPELSELDRGPWSLEQARKFTDELQRKIFAFASGGTATQSSSAMPTFARRFGIAAMAAKIYPTAKKALIAQGRPESEVEAMPVVQVALIHTIQEYQRVRDDSYKWLNLPYWQSYNRVDRAVARTVEQKLANPILALFQTLAPALNSARLASVRVERQLNALQCIEGIRMHAAAHGGELPASLEAMADSPAPIDPITGKPFSYKMEGRSARLTAPPPPGGPNHPAYTINYILKLAD